ncbi:hypothetical protein MHU86_18749 [Fragilaria crotonensis]|nr:hypothetical protein MHU86_18749 [Fragilaria crotonensis]
MTTSPKAAKLNAELVLPILSGLCCTAIQRHASDVLENSEQLVESFLREAIEREDVIHISRALAMKASYFASLGRFDIAVKVQKELEQVYIVEEHSSGLREEYGKDYAAQCFADSVQWYMLTGHQDMAEHQIAVVIGELLSQFDPRDVDTSLDLLFPILIVLKATKKARGAETILFKYAINPFHDLQGHSTRWLPLFNPIAYLFQVLGMIEDNQFDDEVLVQIQKWVLDPEKGIFDSDLQYIGYAMIGELCSLLARIKCHTTDDFQALMERGRIVLTRVVFASGNDKSDTFMVQQARLALDDINLMDDDLDDVDDEFAEEASGEVTRLQGTLLDDTPHAPSSNGNVPSTNDAKIIVSESATPSERFSAGDSKQRMAANKCCSLL